MRHAFDADHIAAIDNTTRKLMAEGQRRSASGFFFSLGHSTVVFVLRLLLRSASGARRARSRTTARRCTRSPADRTGVSGTFSTCIAALNLVVLVGHRAGLPRMRRGDYDEAELEDQLAVARAHEPLPRRFTQGGRASRGRCTRSASSSASGFDTATEVALLFLAGGAAGAGCRGTRSSACRSCSPPACRCWTRSTASFMNFAYGWAFSQAGAQGLSTTSPSRPLSWPSATASSAPSSCSRSAARTS
jgi:high-affinity nickel-transport protein